MVTENDVPAFVRTILPAYPMDLVAEPDSDWTTSESDSDNSEALVVCRRKRLKPKRPSPKRTFTCITPTVDWIAK